MERMSFISRGYTPPADGKSRLREMKKYTDRQSRELYLLLTRLDKRLEKLEHRLYNTESEQSTQV